jgi:uncharacterized membrane protein YphA (DoxX/SURF4 family)
MKIKKIRNFYILTFTISLVLVMIMSFMFAMFNNYQVLITINDYNEAWTELIMIILYLICVIWWVFD